MTWTLSQLVRPCLPDFPLTRNDSKEWLGNLPSGFFLGSTSGHGRFTRSSNVFPRYTRSSGRRVPRQLSSEWVLARPLCPRDKFYSKLRSRYGWFTFRDTGPSVVLSVLSRPTPPRRSLIVVVVILGTVRATFVEYGNKSGIPTDRVAPMGRAK